MFESGMMKPAAHRGKGIPPSLRQAAGSDANICLRFRKDQGSGRACSILLEHIWVSRRSCVELPLENMQPPDVPPKHSIHLASAADISTERLTMPAWTDEEVGRLKRRFVGADEDFGKVLACVQAVWTAADLERLEHSNGFLAWDAYFMREKIIVCAPKEAQR